MDGMLVHRRLPPSILSRAVRDATGPYYCWNILPNEIFRDY